ncbi:MAG: ice-binding family protein, partial [Pseudomonadota bacterium]
TLKQGTTPVSGTVTYAGVTATFTPSSSLAYSTTYTATITTGAKDLAGNAVASNFVWSFTTGVAPDTTPPTVSSTIPVNAATGVTIASTVSATFSEAMDPLTVTTVTFTLEQGLTPVSGTVTYAGVTATFAPAVNLAPSTVYTATITTGAKDLAGNALASNFIWSFATATPTPAQSPVALGSAGSFAVLAGSTVTNTGKTVVGGDLGLLPGVSVTGFATSTSTVVNGSTSTGLTDGQGIVKGTIHIADTAIDPVPSTTSAAQAQLDLTAAYNDAAGRTVGAVLVAGNLGGQTLYPGLYKSTSSLEISSGDLTLDAQGDANAVFVFQMASTLTATTGRQVILSGGAQAANIYWQVGSSATLGTYSVFKGNILAYASITLNTGATLDGRALAQGGAVTLDGNTITVPTP